jgi:hypothetical protein
MKREYRCDALINSGAVPATVILLFILMNSVLTSPILLATAHVVREGIGGKRKPGDLPYVRNDQSFRVKGNE